MKPAGAADDPEREVAALSSEQSERLEEDGEVLPGFESPDREQIRLTGPAVRFGLEERRLDAVRGHEDALGWCAGRGDEIAPRRLGHRADGGRPPERLGKERPI